MSKGSLNDFLSEAEAYSDEMDEFVSPWSGVEGPPADEEDETESDSPDQWTRPAGVDEDEETE